MQLYTDEINDTSPQLYNAMDCALTHEIHNAFKQLPSPGHIYDFERALQAPVLEMMFRGIRVDPYARNTAIKKLKLDRDYVEHMLQEWFSAVSDQPWRLNKEGRPTFPNSSTQLCQFFYDRIGLTPIITKIKGEEKMPMDRNTLEKLYWNFQARPIIQAILAHRDISGQLEVLESDVDPDWRMRCSINIAATSTGRFSSSKSTTGTGKNMQNVTEDLRYIFIADEGKKIAGIDKEQAEAREVGFLCGVLFGDWSYLDAIESADLHTQTARMVWKDLPWTGDPVRDRLIAEQRFYRHFSYRDIAKRAGHASNYFGKPWQISQVLKVPQNMIEFFQDRYFEAYPCIDMMHRWVARELQSKQYLVNVFGRRRDFFDRPDADETLRGAIAYLFQSATADDLNLSMWRIWKKLGTRVELLLQLHDAVYFQYSLDDDEQDVIRTAQKLMEVELNHAGRKFIVPSDPVVGFNMGHRWKRDKDGNKIDANPKGLDKVVFH